MKFWLKLLLLLVIGIPVVAIALANKQMVQISADPFGDASKALSLSLPLFLIIFGALIVGMVIGGLLTWIGQGKHRRAARMARADAANLRAQSAKPAATGTNVVTSNLSAA